MELYFYFMSLISDFRLAGLLTEKYYDNLLELILFRKLLLFV